MKKEARTLEQLRYYEVEKQLANNLRTAYRMTGEESSASSAKIDGGG
jgi:hypothetical protein